MKQESYFLVLTVRASGANIYVCKYDWLTIAWLWFTNPVDSLWYFYPTALIYRNIYHSTVPHASYYKIHFIYRLYVGWKAIVKTWSKLTSRCFQCLMAYVGLHHLWDMWWGAIGGGIACPFRHRFLSLWHSFIPPPPCHLKRPHCHHLQIFIG